MSRALLIFTFRRDGRILVGLALGRLSLASAQTEARHDRFDGDSVFVGNLLGAVESFDSTF